MARRYSRRRSSSFPEIPTPQLLIFIGLFLLCFAGEWIGPDGYSVLRLWTAEFFGTLAVAAAAFFTYRWYRFRKYRPEGLVRDIAAEIDSFRPLRHHSTEALYQMELAGYLKKSFPQLSIEQTRADTRPDIIFGDVAIEVKGPTGRQELRTIADKVVRYMKHYDSLIVVLFGLEIPEDDFRKWRDDILGAFEAKKGKLVILDV